MSERCSTTLRRGRCLCGALLWALGLVLASTSNVQADSLWDIFARGNQAFARGAYADAVREYDALLEAGVDDPDVTFNLASAHAALGHYGQAIRYFERTLRLEPGDEGAQRGLALAHTTLGEREAQRTGEAVVPSRPPLTEALFARVSAPTLAWLLLTCAWLASLCALSLFRVRDEGPRLGLGIAIAFASLVGCVSAFGLGIKCDWGTAGERAIVISPQTALRDGPDEAAQMQAELPEGTAVRVLSRSGAYVRVQSGEREGFVRAEDAGII